MPAPGPRVVLEQVQIVNVARSAMTVPQIDELLAEVIDDASA